MGNNAEAVVVDKKKPEDFIMNPILAVHTQVDDLAIEVDELKDEVKNTTTEVKQVKEIVAAVLKQMVDIRDEGGKSTINGTVGNTLPFFIIDTNKDPQHKVKSAVVVNKGPDILYAGEDAAFSPQVDADLIDVVSDQTRFIPIEPGESERFAYNVRSIKSVHLLSDPAVVGATSVFRVRLAW